MPLTPCFFYEHEFDSRRRYKQQIRQKQVARTHASHSLFFYEHEFDSRRRYKTVLHSGAFLMPLWRFRLVARTHASHAWNTGSIPVGATKQQIR